jgi:hypothetical protein
MADRGRVQGFTIAVDEPRYSNRTCDTKRFRTGVCSACNIQDVLYLFTKHESPALISYRVRTTWLSGARYCSYLKGNVLVSFISTLR